MNIQAFTPSIYNHVNNDINNRNRKCISFFGYTSEFGKHLNEVLAKGYVMHTEKISLIGKLREFLKFGLNSENLLGRGFQGEVYKIDDDFVAKIRKNCTPEASFMDELPDNNFKLLKTYYGGSVASFDDVEILRNVAPGSAHVEVGVPKLFSAKHTEQECIKYYEEVYLPKFSQIPQSSFDEIAKDFSILNNLSEGEYYTFDFANPNNFVLVGNKIRITDEISKKFSTVYNTMSDMLKVFLIKQDLNNVATYKNELVSYRRTLFKKIVMAGMRYNIPVDNESLPMYWRLAVRTLCDAKALPDKIKKTLNGYMKKIPDTELRLQYTQKYLDSIFE